MTIISRRDLMASTGLLALFGNGATASWAGEGAERRTPLPVAGVVTVYIENSHADAILGKILEGFDQKGGEGPDLKLVSLYTDQVPKNDMSRDLAKKHGFRICETIDEAITLATDEVQVAGVFSVGEHGSYPYTEKTKQHRYPRRRFFDEITAAFRRCDKVVPVFNDKHLAYNWRDAKHMYETAKQMKIPMMAGSSLPVTTRIPELVLPKDCQIESALAVGYGGPEGYGFHALETLQCMTERRRDGETGVASVQAVRGDAVWKAEREGRWSRTLLQAALETMPNVKDGKIEDRLRSDTPFYLVDYRDGLKAAVAMANGLVGHFGFAAKLRNRKKPVATWFKLQDGKPHYHFEYLLRAIEPMIHTGRPTYPVERTLLTSGILDAAMHSLADQGKRLPTTELDIRYTAVD